MTNETADETATPNNETPLDCLDGYLDDDRTVHQRMWAITAELPAIGKTQRNEAQNFNFRGHDDVLNALNPLLSKHGVFVLPHVIERVPGERQTSGGKTMYEVNLHVQFTFVGAAGDSVVASTWGEGTDMGDKATSKALTMAFKYALAQVFAVSTAEDYDPDAGAPEETTRGGGSRGSSGGSGGRRSNAQATQAPTVQAGSWSEWMSLMSDYGVNEVESREWLKQAAFAISLDKETQADELWQRANAALGKLAEHEGGVLFVEGARKIVAAAFAYAFKGQLVPGPDWRLDPTETERLTYHEWEQERDKQDEVAATAPEPTTENDIPFGTEDQVAKAKAFVEQAEQKQAGA